MGHKNCPNKRSINISWMCKGATLMTLEHMLGSFSLRGLGIWDSLRCNAEQDVDGDLPCMWFHRLLHLEVKGIASVFILKFHFKSNETISFIYFQASWAGFVIASSSTFEKLSIYHFYKMMWQPGTWVSLQPHPEISPHPVLLCTW